MKPEWRNDEPPKDGTPIVAVGNIVSTDGVLTWVEPFCYVLRWKAEAKCWVHPGSELGIRRMSNDAVVIHFWSPVPAADPSPSWKCSWCARFFHRPASFPPKAIWDSVFFVPTWPTWPISHGMCDECAAKERAQLKLPIDADLQGGAPDALEPHKLALAGSIPAPATIS